jgi:hypothetical protein
MKGVLLHNLASYPSSSETQASTECLLATLAKDVPLGMQ